MSEKIEYMEQDESKYLEYKSSSYKLSDSLFETYSAFANTNGGVIVLGVDEESDQRGFKRYPIQGIQNPQEQEENLVNRLNDTNLVTYNSTEEVIIRTTAAGKKIIKLVVNEAPLSKKPVEVLVTDNNKARKMKAFVRQGSTDVEAKGELYHSLIRNKTNDADSTLMYGTTFSDFDIETIEYYRDIMEKKNKKENKQDFLKDLSHEDFLIRQRALVRDEDTEKLIPTAAGLLFFGMPHMILEKFPYFQLDLFDKRTENRWQHRISTVIDDLNLFQFFEQSHSYLQVTAQNKFQLDENQMRIDGVGALRDALREALVNFCMHTDFSADKPSAINILWDYYDFKNTGMMKIPKENFFTTNDSIYRNPIISKLFTNIGFGERGGTGGGIIFNVASGDLVRYPEIETSLEFTELRVWTVDFTETVGNLSEEEKAVFTTIFKSNIPLGKKELMEAIQLTQYKMNFILSKLTENNYIEKIGRSVSTKYQKKLTPVQQVANIKQMALDLKFPVSK